MYSFSYVLNVLELYCSVALKSRSIEQMPVARECLGCKARRVALGTPASGARLSGAHAAANPCTCQPPDCRPEPHSVAWYYANEYSPGASGGLSGGLRRVGRRTESESVRELHSVRRVPGAIAARGHVAHVHQFTQFGHRHCEYVYAGTGRGRAKGAGHCCRGARVRPRGRSASGDAGHAGPVARELGLGERHREQRRRDGHADAALQHDAEQQRQWTLRELLAARGVHRCRRARAAQLGHKSFRRRRILVVSLDP